MDYSKLLSKELGWSLSGTQQALKLLEEGNTIPFIARYRKEATQEMDEEMLRRLSERWEYLRNLDKRKEEVQRLITEVGQMTPQLETEIQAAQTLQRLEDLYRPYRPKRRTRASVAKEQGLEPLAQILLDETRLKGDLLELAQDFLNTELGISSPEEALAGASDIIAEQAADDPLMRELARKIFWDKGQLQTHGQSKEPTPYEMYYDYTEKVRSIPAHRVLAINRGEKEGVLQVSIDVPAEEIELKLGGVMVKNPASIGADRVKRAIADGCQRLLFPSLEREIRKDLTASAEVQAITVFSRNLRSLLLQPPVRGQVVLALDPGFRTGCKVAVVDETGKLLEVGVIFPHPPQKKLEESQKQVEDLVKKWRVTVIAIGNGTASRETESFVAQLIQQGLAVRYTMVSEAGASIYSASPLAAKEFPGMDLSYRSGVSIARRLQDPLAELVKIDPKSIGVGQYQHDVNTKELNHALGGVVESCVNTVGVELNTASPALLQFVAGLSAAVAKSIVEHRENKGRFRQRQELLQVARLGPQTYQQCAGFIRIARGENPLEETPVHPESYEIAASVLAAVGFSVDQLTSKNTEIQRALDGADVATLAEQVEAGLPTVRDIIEALKRPGRDPREDLPPVLFRQDVLSMEDLQEGMVLQGTVRNVIDFGAFVDIGVKQDGLVHISQICDKFIKHPLEVLSVGDTVKVAVLAIDKVRGRISLTMKHLP